MRAASLAVLVALTGLSALAQTASPWALGAKQAKDGNCAGAVQTLGSALGAAPAPTAEPYLALSDCQAEMNRPAEAEQTLRKGLAAHPASPALTLALGELLMDLHSDSIEVGQLLEKAVRAAPRDPEARHSYARWAHANVRERVCFTQEKAAILLPGLDDDALLQMNTLLGICASRIEDTVEGRAAFRRANAINLRRKPYDPEAAYQFMQFLGRYGDDTELQQIAQQILERVPRYAPALLERAKYFEKENQLEKAVEIARQALQYAGNDATVEKPAHALLARAYTALGDTANAAREQSWLDNNSRQGITFF